MGTGHPAVATQLTSSPKAVGCTLKPMGICGLVLTVCSRAVDGASDNTECLFVSFRGVTMSPSSSAAQQLRSLLKRTFNKTKLSEDRQ